MRGYFPPKVVERFGHLLGRHALRRELVATIMANDVVNSQGITFVSRLCAETGAEQAEVVRAYYVARQVTGAVARWARIEALDGTIDPVLQNQLMVGIDRMVEDVARWYLLHPQPGGLEDADRAARGGVRGARQRDRHGRPRRVARLPHRASPTRLIEQGVDPDLARRHAWQPELTHSPDIAQVAQITGRSIQEVAAAFFLVGERLHIDALEQRVLALESDSRWERWAALAMEDDLMAVRREVAERVLQAAPGQPAGGGRRALPRHPLRDLRAANRLLGGLEGDTEVGLAALTVALRQVRGVAA